MFYSSDELPEDISALFGNVPSEDESRNHETPDPAMDQPQSPEPDSPPAETSDETANEISHENPEPHTKRNCGKTGPTTTIGKTISSFNATKHGLCSKTLILPNECPEEWNALHNRWRNEYGNPSEEQLLSDFLHKTAAAEWLRLRAQREYDILISLNQGRPLYALNDEERKHHDLQHRYLTAAERRFQREYNMLEHHYKVHYLPAKKAAEQAAAKAAEEQEEPEQEELIPQIGMIFRNAQTGEAVHSDGTRYPPPPDWVPQKIVPGCYGPLHPSNFPPPKGIFQKKKKKR